MSEENKALPSDMVLHCPKCGEQHIDEPEVLAKIFACHHSDPMACECDNRRWTNPPHRSHLCHGCGHIWRPADVPTNGVAAVKTVGKNDSPIAAQSVDAKPISKPISKPDVSDLLTWAVLDGVIPMHKVMDADLQDGLEKFAARFAAQSVEAREPLSEEFIEANRPLIDGKQQHWFTWNDVIKFVRQLESARSISAANGGAV